MVTTKNQTIKLDQFIKWIGIAATGGEAKIMIQNGEVEVNGITETRRSRQLVLGDSVAVQGKNYIVKLS